jgi:hypothetical protein
MAFARVHACKQGCDALLYPFYSIPDDNPGAKVEKNMAKPTSVSGRPSWTKG